MFEIFFKVRADHHRDDERVPGEHDPHHGVADQVPEIHEHRGQRAENHQRGLAPQRRDRQVLLHGVIRGQRTVKKMNTEMTLQNYFRLKDIKPRS